MEEASNIERLAKQRVMVKHLKGTPERQPDDWPLTMFDTCFRMVGLKHRFWCGDKALKLQAFFMIWISRTGWHRDLASSPRGAVGSA
ncbi:MAG TPA: hypothetical protein VGC56_09900 [Allosphingosinicella sp.]